MIYHAPAIEEPTDQGDIIDGCPVGLITDFEIDRLDTIKSRFAVNRVIVLTQTCDLANMKSASIVVASVFDAQTLIDAKVVKAADVKGPVRAGRTFGLYFLPASFSLQFGEMLVDLRNLHTVRPEFLTKLCLANKRLARLKMPYREHLAKHFADTYSRIGLPQPYETL